MKDLFYLIYFVLISQIASNADESEVVSDKGRRLTRKKRYLTFPDASSLQLTYCLTVPSVGLRQIMSLGITAGIAWELPTEAEKILEIFGKRKPTTTTTTEPPTTTLPPLIYEEDDHSTNHSNDRIDYLNQWNYDKPTQFKSYYDVFHINKYKSGYSPANIRPIYQPINKNNYLMPNKYSDYYENDLDWYYNHPTYHQVHRRTRRDLYGKIESLFSSLQREGKACVLKALCEVNKRSDEKGTFMEEIVKAIFRIKPHSNYPDEDDYDAAANKELNCEEEFPACSYSVWSDMF